MDTKQVNPPIKQETKKYTTRELLNLYLSLGSYRKVELATGIPHETIFSRISTLCELADKKKADRWKEQRTTVLNNAEFELVCDVLDTDKRAKATQGNAAYAFDKISTARRLEEGLSTVNLDLGKSVPAALSRISELKKMLDNQSDSQLTDDDTSGDSSESQGVS